MSIMSLDRNLPQIQLEILANDVSDNMPPRAKKSKSWYRRIYMSILVILGICIVGYVLIRILQKPIYAVIIDAGSTGSRVQAFNFHRPIFSRNLILDEELYAHINPGLSSYADDPVKGAESLQVLVNKAKAFIPKSKWRDTPLSLKATAGVRLLPREKGDKLLEECEKILKKSGFLISENAVTLMDGSDEGIFSWFTVNFLFERLTLPSHENTVAALDLGGGSTQVTFIPDEKYLTRHEKHISATKVFGNNIKIYAQSYLGMGLMAARKGILTHGQNLDEQDKNGIPVSLIEIHSECINPTISNKWNYSGVEYLVKGSTNLTHMAVKTQNFDGVEEDKPIVRFSECLKIVEKYVDTILDKPIGLENQDIVAFSYYFDRAADVGLVDASVGGIVTVDSFLEQAIIRCGDLHTDYPFLCLDLTYIYTLLRDGFNLKSTTKVRMHRNINNHKLSWALGAALHILENGL